MVPPVVGLPGPGGDPRGGPVGHTTPIGPFLCYIGAALPG
jgi:hypothetical protein